ncbi:hypothetical protein GBAR_LOCUS6748, partial [Geodia barretti]
MIGFPVAPKYPDLGSWYGRSVKYPMNISLLLPLPATGESPTEVRLRRQESLDQSHEFVGFFQFGVVTAIFEHAHTGTRNRIVIHLAGADG